LSLLINFIFQAHDWQEQLYHEQEAERIDKERDRLRHRDRANWLLATQQAQQQQRAAKEQRAAEQQRAAEAAEAAEEEQKAAEQQRAADQLRAEELGAATREKQRAAAIGRRTSCRGKQPMHATFGGVSYSSVARMWRAIGLP
jgi:hypothetical protein